MKKTTWESCKSIFVFFLTLIFIVGLIFSVLDWWTPYGPSTWGNQDEQEEDLPDDKETAADVDIVEGNGISLARARIARTDYALYDVVPTAQTAYTVTATVTTNDGASPEEYQLVDFKLSWTSSNSESVSAYVKMTTTDNTATISLLKAFSTQITLTATSVFDEYKSATATFDYVKGLGSYSVMTADGLTKRDGGESVYMTSKAITNGSTVKVYLANHTTHTITPSSAEDGSWERNVISFPKAATWGTGSVNNTVTSIDVTATYSESFLSSFRSGSVYISQKSYTWSSCSGISQWALLYQIAGDGSNNGAPGYFLGSSATSSTDASKTISFLNALEAATKPVEMSVTINLQYGSPVTLSFYLEFEVAPLGVSDVEMDQNGFLFWE